MSVGQTLHVTVINELGDDFTSVHWHGMEQRQTPYSDGVPGLTQCPINSRSTSSKYHMTSNVTSMMYEFKVTRTGTYWYHGHFHEQYPDGLYGPLIVEDDQVTRDAYDAKDVHYDKEVTLMIADWYEVPASSLLSYYLSPASGGDEPSPDAVVVNNKFTNTTEIRVGRKEKIRIRLISAATFSMHTFSVDGMPLQVIELDATAVDPLTLSTVIINVAQRVSVVLDFSLLDQKLRGARSIYFRVKAMPGRSPALALISCSIV